MGGKSKSSSSQSQTTQSADGFVNAPVINLSAGKSVEFTQVDQFPEGVQEIFQGMIDLLRDTGQAAVNFAEGTVSAAQMAAQDAKQPDLSTVKAIPYIIGTLIIVGGVIAWKAVK